MWVQGSHSLGFPLSFRCLAEEHVPVLNLSEPQLSCNSVVWGANARADVHTAAIPTQRADDARHAFSHAGYYITFPGSLMEPVAQLECGEGWL